MLPAAVKVHLTASAGTFAGSSDRLAHAVCVSWIFPPADFQASRSPSSSATATPATQTNATRPRIDRSKSRAFICPLLTGLRLTTGGRVPPGRAGGAHTSWTANEDRVANRE